MTLAQKSIESSAIDDHMCARCFEDDLEGWMFEVDGIWYCPLHGEIKLVAGTDRRYVVPRRAMVGMINGKKRYEEILRKRSNMNQSSLVVAKSDIEVLAIEFIASVVGVKDLPPAVQQPAARFLAGIFNDYGLDPRLNEVGIFPITKKIGNDWRVVDFGIWYGQTGYERMAYNDSRKWYFGNPRRLPSTEIEERYINLCTGLCKGKGTYEKWNDKTRRKEPTPCDKCEGKGRFDPDDMIVYEVPFYDLDAAKLAKEAGVPYSPDLSLGMFVIGVDTVWQTGTAEGKAQKRARKALLKRNFPLQYRLDNMVKTIEIRDPEDDPIIGPLPENDVSEGSFDESTPLDSNPEWVRELIKLGYTKPEWRTKLGEMLFGDTWDVNDEACTSEIARQILVEFGKRRQWLRKQTSIPVANRIQFALEDLDAMQQEYPETLEGAFDKLQEYARGFVARGEMMPVMGTEKIIKEWAAGGLGNI